MGQHKRRLGYNGETDSSARPGREKVDRGRAAGAEVRSVLPLSELDVSLSVAFICLLHGAANWQWCRLQALRSLYTYSKCCGPLFSFSSHRPLFRDLTEALVTCPRKPRWAYYCFWLMQLGLLSKAVRLGTASYLSSCFRSTSTTRLIMRRKQVQGKHPVAT